MAAHDVLRQAAAIIEKGWSPFHEATDKDGSLVPMFRNTTGDMSRAGANPNAANYSLYGALIIAMGTHGTTGDMGRIWRKLAELIAKDGPPAGGTNHLHPVIGFNRAEGRTQADVVALLTQAAHEFDPPYSVPLLEAPASEPGGNTTAEVVAYYDPPLKGATGTEAERGVAIEEPVLINPMPEPHAADQGTGKTLANPFGKIGEGQ